MPQPDDVDRLADPLVLAHEEAELAIEDAAERASTASGPAAAAGFIESVGGILLGLGSIVAPWIGSGVFGAYSRGGADLEGAFGDEWLWDEPHRASALVLGQQTTDRFARAHAGVRDSARVASRLLSSRTARALALEGVPAGQRGLALTRMLAEQSVQAVRYRNGTTMPLRAWANMAARTDVARAYNAGTLNSGSARGVEWWEVLDGAGCGWTFHEDGDAANGSIRSAAECRLRPLSHPNCRRSFAPRPDIRRPAQVAEALPTVEPGRAEEQAAFEAWAAARTKRRAAARRARTARAARPPRTPRAPRSPRTPGPLTDAEYDAHIAEVTRKVNGAVEGGLDTETLHDKVDGQVGRWTPERERLHESIVDELYEAASAVPRNGRSVMAGGLGGAGKSTTLRSPALGIDAGDYLTLNPDDVKELMARRGLAPAVEGLSPLEASALIHEESSHITQRLASRAYADRTNVMWDTTMSGERSVVKRLDRLGELGYEVEVVFVDIPVETSVQRALARHRRGLDEWRVGRGAGGRYVPPEIIRAHADPEWGSVNRRVFEQTKDRVDRWSLFDNSGSGPRLVEQGGR